MTQEIKKYIFSHDSGSDSYIHYSATATSEQGAVDIINREECKDQLEAGGIEKASDYEELNDLELIAVSPTAEKSGVMDCLCCDWKDAERHDKLGRFIGGENG